jgi:crotonobetainyl-CoA:carnitine CoA-transferase CaiB-like acyl-CoA transferase
MAGWLEGIRVLSFTTGVAGPNAARLLAQCGAEVIKIESRRGGVDSFRFFSSQDSLDAAPRFIEANLNVLSAQLNLKHPTGVRLLRELAAKSDVVLDNFRPDVLPRLGLGPEEFRQVRPDLIVLKMPGLGSTGPKHRWGTWGITLTAFSGMTYLWNHPGQPRPVGSQAVYPDYVAAVFAPTIVLAALLYRRRTGQGLFLDLAQVELTAYLLGVSFLEIAVNGREPTPCGNDWPYAAPHNCYPCQGEDRWCVIAVETDEQWRRLCAVLGRPELADDPRYATLARRREHLAEIDALIAAWTRQREAHAVMHTLQAAGVPCGVVQSGEDLYHDPHLRARGFISTIDHPVIGQMPVAGIPMHLPEGALAPVRSAATLGAHNEYVFCELLGYSREQLAAWQREGVVD